MARVHSRGDTLIELILAFTIFSVAGIAAIMVMNRGLALSQHSLEVTLVRQQMDGQAETIRYLRDTSSDLWSTIKSYAVGTKVAPLSPVSCPDVNELTSVDNNLHGFFVGRDTATEAFSVNRIDTSNFETPATFAKVDSAAQKTYGVWVQVAEAENGGKAVQAYDVYIHACWDSVAMANRPATLGTIVRIYDR